MRKIELLAPAKNLECAITAIDSGADAVYIGGPSFGARVNAPNTLDDIKSICDHAHLFGARVHVTVNTILTNAELEAAREMSFKLYDLGVDALIIQDLGLLRGPLPPLELHASTQQNNSSPEKVKFLEEAGFSQVVLARELSVDEIRAIRSETSVKLEAFVHGALCVGVSGRCYLSAAITGRSANRGECAQLCRVAQSLYDGDGNCLAKDKYLLSMRDLNQSKNLEELIDAGISSFKIEGRLKDESYVRNITAFYRQRLDEIFARREDLSRSSYGRSDVGFVPDPSKSFNRGFTEYNTHEIKDNYANFDAPGFVGSKIGTLVGQRGHDLVFRLSKKVRLHNGDSLNYYRENGNLEGFRISTVKGEDTTEIFQQLPKIEKGTEFFRSKDAEFEKTLSSTKSVRKLSLSLVYEETDHGARLYGRDESGCEAMAELTLPELQTAKDEAKLRDNLASKLGRLGDSVYELESLELKLMHKHFVPQSAINRLRRDLILSLDEQKRSRRGHVSRDVSRIPKLPEEERHLGFKANIYNDEAESFYKDHGAENIVRAYESSSEHDEETVLISKHCLRYCFKMCPIRHKTKAPKLFLVIGKTRFKLEFDCKKCLMSLKGPLQD